MKRPRFQKDDWLAFALNALAEKGPDALKLQALCKAADRTVGSFYHHFEDVDVFFEELGIFWREKNTRSVIAALEKVQNPNDNAARLRALASNLSVGADLGMRNLAERRSDIRQLVDSVDQERIAYLQDIYAARFDLETDHARTMAELEYAAFIGTQVLWRKDSREIGARLSQTFDAMVQNMLSKERPPK